MLLLNLHLTIDYNDAVSTLICIDTQGHPQNVSVTIYTHIDPCKCVIIFKIFNMFLKLSDNNSAVAEGKLLIFFFP